MKKYGLLYSFIICFVVSCGGRPSRPAEPEAVTDPEPVVLARYADTVYASAATLKYSVALLDSTSGLLSYLHDPYLTGKGDNLTFRGSQKRDYPLCGRLDTTATRLEKVWEFKTRSDAGETVMGFWGGGSGWTSQPLHVHWPDSSAMPCKDEIIVSSLCGRVYFIDFMTGEASRPDINMDHALKGTPSLDPSLSGLLFVGHGVRKGNSPCGMAVIDLNSHKISQAFGHDPKALRGWDGNDSSPIVAGGFLFRPSENATIYKYRIDGDSLVPHSCLRYRDKSGAAPGVESSMAVSRNYGWVGDNRGNIICINLDTLTPVWVYDNHDDSDATIVVEEEDGIPYLYTGTEVDKQGDKGFSYLVKLNGLTGERIWEHQHPCSKVHLSTGKILEGGMYSTPLLGHGDCDSLLFTCFETHKPSLHGEFVALNRKTGEVVYTIPLQRYAWSSPVPFYFKDKLYIVQPGGRGEIYLIDALKGEVLDQLQVGDNFESSAAVYEDTFVIGSRGTKIFKLRVI